MKSISFIAFMGAILLVAVGCVREEARQKSAEPSSEVEETVEKSYRLAYIARAQGDAFASWLANSIEDEAENYPHLSFDIFDSQADDSKENAFIENAITNNYDAIIVQPNDGEAQRPYVEQIVKAGIPAITTNPRIPDIEGAHSVDADPYEQAAVSARLALEQVPQNAKVVVLLGPPGNAHSVVRREAWQKEFFDKRNDVEIVGEQAANWNKGEAIRHMEDWMQAHSTIDAIIAMNDSMVAGALEATKDDPRYQDTLSYSVDGSAEAALLIQEGRLTSTAFQNAYLLGKMIVRTADDLVTGKVKSIDLDIECPLITKDNVDLLLALHRQAGSLS